MQEFMGVYKLLRQQLLDDPLTTGQPEFARNHLGKVRLHSSRPCAWYSSSHGHVLADAGLQCARRQAQQRHGRGRHSHCCAQSPGAPDEYAGGRCHRQLSALHAAGFLSSRLQAPKQEEQFHADVLGWCIEWVRLLQHAALPLLPCMACS